MDLLKCPVCGQVYLIDFEADVLYLDPSDLTRWADIGPYPHPVDCTGCGVQFPQDFGIGAGIPATMRVSWQLLAASNWFWVSQEIREQKEQHGG